ncbi:lipopolysaccharide biosynthesis protein [Microbacterium sp. NPDC089188]|uniref:lipopolysaccharide biosynthesis protein n=1 Tax=Microbacterium sp. NPDC089188 TaxID=3154971 RepID=UPI003433F15D
MTTGLGRRALGGAGATLLWQGVRLGLLAVSIVVLARLLDPTDYGYLAMVTAVIGLGELLRDLGLSMAAVQAKNVSAAEKSNLFWLNSAIGLVLAIAVFLGSWGIAAIYGESALVPITQVLSVTFLLNGVAAQFKAQINRDMRFMTLGVTEAAPQAVALVLAIVLALCGFGYWALVAQALTVAALALTMDVILARWHPSLPSRTTSIRRFLRFGGALAGTQGIAYAAKNIDTVVLGILFGSSVVGLYSRAFQLVVLPLNQLTAPLSRVAVPVLSRIQDDRARFIEYIRTGQYFTVTLATIFYATLVGFAEPVVLLVLGERWLPAAPILQALALVGIFRALGQVPYWIFVSLGLTGKQLTIYLVTQPLVVVAILVGAPWGPVGVGIGGSIGYFLFWIIQMWWAGRTSGLPAASLTWSGLVAVVVTGVPIAVAGFLGTVVFQGPVALTIAAASAALWSVGVNVVVPSHRRRLGAVRALIRRR